MSKTVKCILAFSLPLAVGWLGSLFTTPAITGWYAALNKPLFNPPNWVFAPVWTTLFILMGLALYLVWQSHGQKKMAVTVFLLQLLLNLAWSGIFFALHRPGWALVELCILWLAILMNIILFYRLSKWAAILLVPYLLWVSFAAVLNFNIWVINKTPVATTSAAVEVKDAVTITIVAVPTPVFALPLDRALARVTKKPFGIHVDPTHSPVSPDRFHGYHTGVDFEAFPEEVNTPVVVYAICSGKLLRKQWASGYGGMLVESCGLNKQPITVVYGHVSLASVSAKVGDTLEQGKQIAVLGKGYSTETDGERKHLHLGIHTGAAVDTRGYVATESELTGWVNVMEYLK